ncbi:hypothetical protein [Vibrio navarrensis]|uniref:hypothetical protein n=1 Tax=Vibrio navarrensis TaxID=29495 RepID=UPI001302320B|nr:hypothetical protein [Vibrio navarrensis]
MSKPITKEMWKQIEDELSGSYASMKFQYEGRELSIERVHVRESQTALAVYIDGSIEWKHCHREGISDFHRAVWRNRSMAVYKEKEIKDIERIFGKRDAKKNFPNLYKRTEYLDPLFPKASVLVRQFKKLDGLELTKAMFLNLEEKTL